LHSLYNKISFERDAQGKKGFGAARAARAAQDFLLKIQGVFTGH
jgi:hypothetical protein